CRILDSDVPLRRHHGEIFALTANAEDVDEPVHGTDATGQGCDITISRRNPGFLTHARGHTEHRLGVSITKVHKPAEQPIRNQIAVVDRIAKALDLTCLCRVREQLRFPCPEEPMLVMCHMVCVECCKVWLEAFPQMAEEALVEHRLKGNLFPVP